MRRNNKSIALLVIFLLSQNTFGDWVGPNFVDPNVAQKKQSARDRLLDSVQKQPVSNDAIPQDEALKNKNSKKKPTAIHPNSNAGEGEKNKSGRLTLTGTTQKSANNTAPGSNKRAPANEDPPTRHISSPPPVTKPPEGPAAPQKPYWVPLCFFMDPDYDENFARKTIKTVVDAFAACDIAVDVHATTLKRGTYDLDLGTPSPNPNDPQDIKEEISREEKWMKKLNDDAEAHCDYKSFYGNGAIKGAAQTHPHSDIASDVMCAKNQGELEQKLRQNPKRDDPSIWDTAGCANTPEGVAKPVSIVDWRQGGDVATHEFGHNRGEPGKGGSYLENYGEDNGNGNEIKTDGGYGLQLKYSPVIAKLTTAQVPEGKGSGGFTNPGCNSLRGGANDNSARKIPYNKDALESYYTRINDPAGQLDFDGRARLYLSARTDSPSSPKEPPQQFTRNPKDGRALSAKSQSVDPGHPLQSSVGTQVVSKRDTSIPRKIPLATNKGLPEIKPEQGKPGDSAWLSVGEKKIGDSGSQDNLSSPSGFFSSGDSGSSRLTVEDQKMGSGSGSSNNGSTNGGSTGNLSDGSSMGSSRKNAAAVVSGNSSDPFEGKFPYELGMDTVPQQTRQKGASVMIAPNANLVKEGRVIREPAGR